MPFGLSDKIFGIIISTFSSNKNIESAILFGSRAKGTYKPGSDIDIVIKGTDLTIDDIIKLQNIFDELDQVYTFDILIFQDITEPALLNHIERAGIEIFRRE
jgi:predicted nucleotidyltransferase